MALLLGYVLVASAFVLGFYDTIPYDDSYFFKRVAMHALEGAGLSWNASEGPVYGSTSLAFQWLSVGVTAIAPHGYVLAMRIVAWASLCSAYLVLSRLTFRYDRGVACWLGMASPMALQTLLSGMETALSFLCLALSLVLSMDARAWRGKWLARAAAVVLVYLVRPDAVLLALGGLVVSSYAREKRWPVRELAVSAVGLGVVLAFAKLYFGTALPLPFYAKQAAFTPYDAAFRELSRPSSMSRFAVYLLFSSPLWLLASAKRDALNVGLLVTASLHTGYHLVSTVDVMGMHGRFYAPALPLLIVAGARGADAVMAGTVRRQRVLGASFALVFAVVLLVHFTTSIKMEGMSTTVLVAYGAALLGALVLRSRTPAAVALVGAAALAGVFDAGFETAPRWRSDAMLLQRHVARGTVFRGIESLRACLGDRIHVYHSEVGVPGLLFVDGEVTDLAGLMSPAWLFRGSKVFDDFCLADKPEAIFLPHKNYATLNREIRASRCIKDYRRAVTKSASPLFVRADLAKRLSRCAAARRDSWISEGID